jgi:hypothetical protein
MTTIVDGYLQDVIFVVRCTVWIVVKETYADSIDVYNDEHLQAELGVLKKCGLASVITKNSNMLFWAATEKVKNDLDRVRRGEKVYSGDQTLNIDVATEEDDEMYGLLFEAVILGGYECLVLVIGNIWKYIKDGKLARIVTADGRVIWEETPRAVFCGVRDTNMSKHRRSIFTDLQRLGLMKIVTDLAGHRSWYPTAEGMSKGFGAAEGAATELLRDFGYIWRESFEADRLIN